MKRDDSGIRSELEGELTGTQQPGDSEWLTRTRDAYRTSSDFMDSSLRKMLERNVDHFHNRHAKGSKFQSSRYANRNRFFHPKSRHGARASEAAFAAAMFSTADLVSISAENDNDPRQQASAEINQALLQYRLENSIPWFLTAVGAFQDAYVAGVCFSHNYWEYKERKVSQEVLVGYDLDGSPIMETEQVVEVVKDKPCIDLIPVENLRIHPAADWRDPINTSPYVIRDVPMNAGEVLERMGSKDEKTGAGKWRPYELSQLLATSGNDNDTTRRAREGGEREDSHTVEEGNLFSTVWLRQYFMRVDGEEMVWWTVGDQLMLSDPQPLKEAYLHGVRPITMGISVVETHKNYPESPIGLQAPLQDRVNSLINQRHDNVDLVLNKRYYLRRGAKIDHAALMRNTPGGGVTMGDINKDIRTEEHRDVTGSAYQEQDRLDVQLDEIAGTFSQASVHSNRALSETVGGMELMNSSASEISEYTIRIFVETWVEPTLKQLIKLEQAYETDQVVMAIAADKAELYQRYGQDLDLDALLEGNLTLRVDVGIGATNPQQKLKNFQMGMQMLGQIAPEEFANLDREEVSKEIFGKLGYRDGKRFFLAEDERPEQQPPPPDPMIEVKMQELQLRSQRDQAELALKQQGQQMEYQKHQEEMALKERLEMTSIAARENLTIAQLQANVQTEQAREQNKRDIAALNATNEQTKIQLQNRNLSQGFDTF